MALDEAAAARGRRWGVRQLLGVTVALSALAVPGAAPAQTLPTPGLFKLESSNGYSVVVWGVPPRRGWSASVVVFVHGRAGAATYFAPATVTQTSIQANLGELGEIDVDFQPSGRVTKEKSACDDELVAFDSGVYEGVIEFTGEEGYTQVSATRAKGDIQFALDIICPGVIGPSGSGPGVPGGELRVRQRSLRLASTFLAHKNRPGARAFFAADITEKRDGIAIERSAESRDGSVAFEYDPLLQVAVVRPPPPFSGRATFQRNAELAPLKAAPTPACSGNSGRVGGRTRHCLALYARYAGKRRQVRPERGGDCGPSARGRQRPAVDRGGMSTSAISRWVASGRLHRLHQGVYAVGHSALSSEARWMAAVLACGAVRVGDGGGRGVAVERGATASRPSPTKTVLDYWGAALSHRSAAVLWGLLPPVRGAVDVTVPGYGGRARRRGIRLHRTQTLQPAAATLRGGIPVTTPERTLADLRRSASARPGRGLVSPGELRRAIRQASVLGLPLGEEANRDRTRSDLESAFLRLCRRHGLPSAEVNVRIGPHLVDFLWRDESLVVETDGYRYHRGRVAFEDDRARDVDLQGRGFRVVRLSNEQVRGDSKQVAATLRRLLQCA